MKEHLDRVIQSQKISLCYLSTVKAFEAHRDIVAPPQCLSRTAVFKSS